MSTDLVQANSTHATIPAESGSDLSATQIAVLDALLSGKTATDAAAAAGIGRRTLYDWLRKDFRFQAALNRGRRDLQQAVACRVEQLAAEATECVAQAVRNGDVKAALEILKRANVFTAAKVGSDDERVLQFEQEEREEDRKTRLGLARRCNQSYS